MRRALLVPLVLAAALGTAGAAQDARPAAEDVAALREIVRQRRWEDARAAALALLEARQADPDVRPHLAEVEELLQRSLFGLAPAVIDPGVALGPGVVKYTPSTRAVQIRADAATSAKWPREADGTRTCPIPFEGDVSVEIAWGDADDWAVILGWDADAGTGWRVEPRAQDHSPSPGRVVRMDEDGEKLLGPVAAPRSKEPSVVRVSRAGAAIFVTADKVQLAQEVANGDRRAHVAFRPSLDAGDDPRLPEVRIAGHVESRFARKAAAAAESFAFQAWRTATYRRADVLPAWVLDLERTSRRWTERAPDVPESAAAPFRDAIRATFERDAGAVRRRDDELRDVELPEGARAFLEALRACADRRPADAEPVLRKLREEMPSSAAVAAALGACLALRRADDEALRAFEAARAVDPEYAPAHAGPARIALFAGDTDAAQAHLDAAARAGTSSDDLEWVRSRVARLRRGPSWPKRIERAAGPFSVAGDAPKAAVEAVAKALEAASADFAARVRPLPAGTKLRAWVFADEAAWLDWCREGGAEPDEDAAAVGVLGVAVRVPADGAVDAAIVRRAAAEAWLFAIVRDRLPAWLETGLPRVLSAAPAAKSVKPGPSREGGLAARFRNRFAPWPDVFLDDGRVRGESPDVFRVQSAAAARALLDAQDAALKGVLGAYVVALARGADRESAFRAVLEPALPAIENAAGAPRR